MEQCFINCENLKDFIGKHKLRNTNSSTQFNSIVTIDTEKNHTRNEKIVIMITFSDYDSYGKLTFIDDNLDSNSYPTVFDAKWGTMQHINDEYLQITGYHKQNPNIGKYTVKITPI